MRLFLAAALLLAATPAAAAELFGGVMAHGVDTPFTDDIHESGVDIEAGWRGDRLSWLSFLGRPQPHLLLSVNTGGDTSFAAAGISWKLGRRLYARPGIGIAVHDGPSYRVRDGYRTDLGSRVLFEPELSVGMPLSSGIAVEASWVHISHAQLFSGQNPGLDTIGLRLAVQIR